MSFDAHANLALARITSAPSPALSGTSLNIDAAYLSLFPAAPFNCTVYPPNVPPTAANAEIVRVTLIVGNTFTIVRAQEGTTAKAIAVGWSIANTSTAKVFTDIESAIAISAGTQNAPGPFTFADGGGITFGMSNGTVTATVAGGGGGGGSVNFSAGTTSNNLASITFADANNIIFGLDNGTLTAQAIVASFIPGFSAQGGSSTYPSILTFVNGNGITFINSAGSVAASHNGITQQSTQPVAASASNGSFLFSTLNFTDANGVTFGTSAGGIIFASVATAAGGNSVNFSAGTQSSNLGSVVFADSNGISFGLSNGTITATVATAAGGNSFASFFQNEPGLKVNTIFVLDTASQRGGIVQVPYNLSVGFIRFPMAVTHNVTLPAANATGINASVQNRSTWAVFVYTQGTGASSSNYNLYASGTGNMTVLNSISAGAGASTSQHSYTQRITYQVQGGSATFENTYAVSDAGNYQFGSSAFLSSFSGSRYIDINLATSISAGAYLVLFAFSSSSLTNYTLLSNVTVVAPNYTGWYGHVNDTDFRFTQMGSTQNSSRGTQPGWGCALGINGTSTLDPVPITSLVPLVSGVRPMIHFARTA